MKTAREIELEKELKLFKIAYLLIINDLLPDMKCDNCRYKNKEYCEEKDCYSAIYYYFLNKAKE